MIIWGKIGKKNIVKIFIILMELILSKQRIILKNYLIKVIKIKKIQSDLIQFKVDIKSLNIQFKKNLKIINKNKNQ